MSEKAQEQTQPHPGQATLPLVVGLLFSMPATLFFASGVLPMVFMGGIFGFIGLACFIQAAEIYQASRPAPGTRGTPFHGLGW